MQARQAQPLTIGTLGSLSVDLQSCFFLFVWRSCISEDIRPYMVNGLDPYETYIQEHDDCDGMSVKKLPASHRLCVLSFLHSRPWPFP